MMQNDKLFAFTYRREKTDMNHIQLTKEEDKAFRKTLKCGIYKELHQKNLLTDTQLDLLLGQQK